MPRVLLKCMEFLMNYKKNMKHHRLLMLIFFFFETLQITKPSWIYLMLIKRCTWQDCWHKFANKKLKQRWFIFLLSTYLQKKDLNTVKIIFYDVIGFPIEEYDSYSSRGVLRYFISPMNHPFMKWMKYPYPWME